MSDVTIDKLRSASTNDTAGYSNKSFTVSSFLQAIEQEQRTCTLELQADSTKGRLHIQKGVIIDAATDDQHGETAAIDILSWKKANIKIIQANSNMERKIRSSLANLMVDAHKRKDAKDQTDQLIQAIRVAEANHYKQAHVILSTYLQSNHSNSLAWLWYSRCLGNLHTISEALAKSFQLTPKNLKVIEEIHKLKQAHLYVKEKRLRRCPFCWSPLDSKGAHCYYCRAGISIPEALNQKTQRQVNSKFLISSVTRYTDVIARENNAKAGFYLCLAYCNLNRAKEALDLLTEISNVNPDNKFLSNQLNFVLEHVATRLTDYTEIENHSAIQAADNLRPEPAVQTIKKKILVVEDSPTTRKVVALTLKQQGYDLVEARDGLEALSKIDEERPHLVLLDIVLPKMDGYRILSIIKKTQELKDTPVILLTSKDGLINKVKGRLAGSTAYLTKPFEPKDLIETVRKHIG